MVLSIIKVNQSITLRRLKRYNFEVWLRFSVAWPSSNLRLQSNPLCNFPINISLPFLSRDRSTWLRLFFDLVVSLLTPCENRGMIRTEWIFALEEDLKMGLLKRYKKHSRTRQPAYARLTFVHHCCQVRSLVTALARFLRPTPSIVLLHSTAGFLGLI